MDDSGGQFWHGVNYDGVMDLLEKILQNLLEQTFQQPNEYATQLAYHACFYLNKLRELRPAGRTLPPQATEPTAPTDFQLNVHNPLIEAEATLSNLANNHVDLPMRHVQRELLRAEALLKEGRALLKSWSNDPEAPGALPGTAATRNALDGIDWALLATEEGGVATMDEAIRHAAEATQRSNQYMMELISWLQGKFSQDALAVEDTTQTYVEYLLNLYHADNMVQLPHYFDENKETTVYYLALETLDKIVHLL
ncbi:hypothetical protein AK812_SmicGene28074 [Symbiodinium microadriaticum]|uniref:Uncharacterized protein n=1 Tax=Symbiodinium microadriaticum TaxID=2951 RepID=A0A1Q9D5E5_SYMMI|nr:hypothetical protein AK812_SmicGene28074 [Symbiodinium microadriaticum]